MNLEPKKYIGFYHGYIFIFIFQGINLFTNYIAEIILKEEDTRLAILFKFSANAVKNQLT
jgi:hypothetical protein